MGNHGEKVIYGIKKFVGFPETDFGRKLVVLFHLLALVLGVTAVGEGRGYKDMWK